jgi:hypothetical protein
MLQVFTSNEISLVYMFHMMLNLHSVYLCSDPEDGFG